MHPADLSLADASGALGTRELSSTELVRACLERIEERNADLNAFTQVFAEPALSHASDADARQGAGETRGPLDGVPVAIKDNICTISGLTTCGSRILEGYASPFDAGAIERLHRAGAIVIGKTNLDEFAMGSSCERSIHGPTRNPLDPDRVPGGSSGGSACAVGANMVPGALGSDTGGSIRQPASFCGITGYKPTYGLVSRWGLVAYASSLDQIGPLARSVDDCALLASVIMGFDDRDSTSARRDPPALDGTRAELSDLRFGVPLQARSAIEGTKAQEPFERALKHIRSAGATIVDVDIPELEHAVSAYYIVAPAEASSNLARFDGIRYGRRAALGPGEGLETLYARSRSEGFGDEVQRRIMLGTYVLSAGYYDAYYLSALRARRLLKNHLDEAFAARPGCDAILTPTTPGGAFPIGALLGDPLAMYAEDLFTVIANLAGLPAISLPAGECDDGGARMPQGIQLMTPAFADDRLLSISRAIEALGPP